MIRSMTGYGRGEVRSAAGTLTVEIRSVNNRYLDVQIKMPRSLAILEPRVKKMVQDGFFRGRLDVFISRSGAEANPVRFVLDAQLAGQYLAVLNELKARFSLPGDVDLSMVAGIQDVVAREEIGEDLEDMWRVLSGGITQSMTALRSMREDEGAALVRDITERLASIEVLSAKIRSRLPETIEYARKRMTDALERILNDRVDPQRIAQEIAILAERTDVSEELTRLASHLVQFRSMVSDAPGDAVGRKLDFLLQEMGREANTIASKAQDADVSLQVVNIKAELEKIREQIQNIE